MVKTYKKKQTRRRQRQRRQRASVRRIRKIQRGGSGADDAIKAIVEGIEISVVRNALIQVEIIVPSENPRVTLTVEQTNTPPSNKISKTPVSFILDNNEIDFFIVEPTSGSKLQSVYIYLKDNLNKNLYGRVMIVINGNNMGSYNSLVATAIFNAINNKPDLQRYKK